MIKVNENYGKLKASYLFADIAKRVETFQAESPDKKIIKLGIGDVTKPLPDACIKAFHQGVDEMAKEATFRGYGPSGGYPFIREIISKEDFQKRGAAISSDEIFVSDGSKCDTANFQELFANDIKIGIPDPVYPVYLDSNVMAGRTGPYEDGRYQGIHYLECTKENNFLPEIPDTNLDLIYLCFPNNPIGTTASKQYLKQWVDYARENKALILFDAAYEAFIRDGSPHSIFEIEGAKEVAVEFRSFSKTAGFTGTRCAITIVSKECMIYNNNNEKISLHSLWSRRQNTKFNGVSYPVQKAAAAVYSVQGQKETKSLVSYYLKNAEIVTQALDSLGFEYVGGGSSPYIWVDGKNRDSWEFFQFLLSKAAVVCTPGAGFGKCGDKYIRISAFNSHENVKEAMRRLKDIL
ncbi:MAG: LL-diaminopimelate aminotransferase [Desulfobacterales bacterium]|nr:LL-diaminopimelate aminotransferase [Desulfobacterales bacterium]